MLDVTRFLSQLHQTQNGRFCFPLRLYATTIKTNRPVVGLTGFEPVTLRLSSACSNQLSYRPAKRGMDSKQNQPLVEAWGFEPQTYSLQSYRSTN